MDAFGFLMLALVGLVSRSERVHGWLASAVFLTFDAYIALLFLRLA